MERLRLHYDRITREWKMNQAIVVLLSFIILCLLGALQIRDGLRTHEHSYFVLAGCSLLVGVLGVFHSVLAIRAVVRRKGFESKSALE